MVVEHHARCLGGFARSVRNVEALDRELVQVLRRQVQCLGQGTRAGLLRALFRQKAGQLQVGVLLRHVEPGTALLARLVDGMYAHTGLLGQCVHQRLVHRHAGDQQGRHRHADVMLGDEGFQHQCLYRARDRRGMGCGFVRAITALFLKHGGGILYVHGEVRPVTQVAATAHHGQIDAGAPALHTHGEDVHILVVHRFNGLLVQHPRQRLDLVAHLGRLLEFELVRVRHHAHLQRLQQLLRFTTQQRLSMLHVGGIGFGRNQVHTRPGAALDLVQQAGPRAVGKHRVFAGAQPEHFLQKLNALLHRPGAGVRAKVAVLFVHRPTVVRHARKDLPWRVASGPSRAGDLEVRVALVVAEQDVELGVQRLDQVVFQQQRLGLGAHHRGLHAHDLADHVADARAAMVLLEVAGHPALEVERLAHVQERALGVEIAIDAGQRGQRGHLRQQFFGVHVRHGAYCGLMDFAIQKIAACTFPSSAGGPFILRKRKAFSWLPHAPAPPRSGQPILALQPFPLPGRHGQLRGRNGQGLLQPFDKGRHGLPERCQPGAQLNHVQPPHAAFHLADIGLTPLQALRQLCLRQPCGAARLTQQGLQRGVLLGVDGLVHGGSGPANPSCQDRICEDRIFLRREKMPGESMFCTQCGTPHAGDARFCAQCGRPAASSAPPALAAAAPDHGYTSFR